MTTAKATSWRNRICGHGEESPASLKANPRNWRLHPAAQKKALAAALGEVGWVQDVIVNRRTGNLIDGHARVELALVQGEPSVPVVYVDLDENEEGIILASLDPLAGMANMDPAKWEALMASVSVSSDELKLMLLRQTGEDDPANEYQGMPEYEQEDLRAWRSIRVNFATLADLEAFGKVIGQNVTEVTRSIWYPKSEQDHYVNHRYVRNAT